MGRCLRATCPLVPSNLPPFSPDKPKCAALPGRCRADAAQFCLLHSQAGGLMGFH